MGPAYELLSLHNAERERRGYPELAWDEELAVLAQVQAERMEREGGLSHSGTQGVAENCAGLTESISDAMGVWMRSFGHRANVFGPYRRLGAGYCGGWWCVVFGA